MLITGGLEESSRETIRINLVHSGQLHIRANYNRTSGHAVTLYTLAVDYHPGET
jgi:hypothetical protein